MNVTGSPVKLNNPNAMKATTAMTSADCNTRRRMKASTEGCDFDAEYCRIVVPREGATRSRAALAKT